MSYESKFFTHDVPKLMRILERLAKALEKLEPIDYPPASGNFDKITDEEVLALAEKEMKFDGFFEQLSKNFKLDNSTEFDVVDLKKLCQHAWNANYSQTSL